LLTPHRDRVSEDVQRPAEKPAFLLRREGAFDTAFIWRSTNKFPEPPNVPEQVNSPPVVGAGNDATST